MDGTLLDSMPVWETAGCRWLRSVGVPCRDDLARELTEMSFDEATLYLHDHFSLAQTPAEIREGVLGVIRTAYTHEIPAKPGAADFLAALNAEGIPIAIASSGDDVLIAAALERLHLMRYITKIVTCADVGTGKQNPDVYLRAAEYLGTNPAQTFVFEDALYAVRTANRAGFVTVGVYDLASFPDHYALRKECTFYLHDLTDYAEFRQFAGGIQSNKQGEKS